VKKLKTQGKTSITPGKNSRFRQIFAIEKKYIFLTNEKGLQRYENIIESVMNYDTKQCKWVYIRFEW